MSIGNVVLAVILAVRTAGTWDGLRDVALSIKVLLTMTVCGRDSLSRMCGDCSGEGDLITSTTSTSMDL
jgi:hypothetical protein